MSDPTNNLSSNTGQPAGTDPDSVVDPHWRSSTRARLVAAAGLAALAAAVTATVVATSNSTPSQHDAAAPLGAPSADPTPASDSSATGSSSSTLSGTSSPRTSGRPAGVPASSQPTPTQAVATTPARGPGQPASGTAAVGHRPASSTPRRAQHTTSHRAAPPHRPKSTPPHRPKPRPTSPAPAPFHAHWVYVAGPSAFNGHKIGSYSTSLARSCANSSDLSSCNTSGVQWGGGCSNLYYGAKVPDGAPVGWAVWEFADGQCKYAMSAGNPGGD